MTISPVAHRPATPVIEVNVRIAFPKGSEPYILHQQGRAGVCVGLAVADRPRPEPNDARSDRPNLGHAVTQTDAPMQIEARPDRPGVVCAAAQADLPTQTDARDGGNADHPQACVPQEHQLTPKQLEFLRTRKSCRCRKRLGSDSLGPQSRDLERGVPRPVPDTSTGSYVPDYPESRIYFVFCPYFIIGAAFYSSFMVFLLVMCGICKPEYKLKVWMIYGFWTWLGSLGNYFDLGRISFLVHTGHICKHCHGLTDFGKARSDRMYLSSKVERKTLGKSKPESVDLV